MEGTCSERRTLTHELCLQSKTERQSGGRRSAMVHSDSSRATQQDDMGLTQAGSFPSHCSTSKTRQRVSFKDGDFSKSDPHLSPPASSQRASLPLSSFFFPRTAQKRRTLDFRDLHRAQAEMARATVCSDVDRAREGGGEEGEKVSMDSPREARYVSSVGSGRPFPARPWPSREPLHGTYLPCVEKESVAC